MFPLNVPKPMSQNTPPKMDGSTEFPPTNGLSRNSMFQMIGDAHTLIWGGGFCQMPLRIGNRQDGFMKPAILEGVSRNAPLIATARLSIYCPTLFHFIITGKTLLLMKHLNRVWDFSILKKIR